MCIREYVVCLIFWETRENLKWLLKKDSWIYVAVTTDYIQSNADSVTLHCGVKETFAHGVITMLSCTEVGSLFFNLSIFRCDALLCLWNCRTWGHLNLLQACIKIYMMPQRTRSEPTFPWVFFHLPLFPHSSSLSFSSPLSLFFLHLHSLFCGSFLLFGPHWCSEMQDWHWATTEQQIY